MRDRFLQERPTQPKREICDYLESEGIRVPSRIADLQDAIRGGHKFIIRGEHPQDYDGASDLLESMVVDPEKDFFGCEDRLPSEEAIVDKVSGDGSMAAKDNLKGHLPILSQQTAEGLLTGMKEHILQRYCELLGREVIDHLRQVSYSYWQYVEGCNHAVIADSAIRNRYHIFSFLFQTERTMASYIISQNGDLSEQSYKSDRNAIAAVRAPRLIDLYESVRNLPKFDPNHCPIIEVQTTDDEVDYCLQVHRTRDFEESQLDLNGTSPEETYVSRGATPIEGGVYNISFLSGCRGETLPQNFKEQEGAYLFTYDPAFIELNLKRRGVHLIHTGGRNDPFHATKLACKHNSRSEMFKPPVSVQLPVEDILKKGEDRKLKRDPTVSIPVRITSDGKRAIAERAD